jgi:signal transduction histidine kinase
MRLNLHECDLSSLVAESVENIRPSTDAKHLELHAAIAPGILVLGDRDRIRQVLWNILANAVKFTPRGGRIDVELSSAAPQARIVVRDTGIGMTAATIPLIFQRFWQADGGRTREFGGLGLGLALSRHFVDLHGGTIGAKSDGPGKGAEFQVELPLSPPVPAVQPS